MLSIIATYVKASQIKTTLSICTTKAAQIIYQVWYRRGVDQSDYEKKKKKPI